MAFKRPPRAGAERPLSVVRAISGGETRDEPDRDAAEAHVKCYDIQLLIV